MAATAAALRAYRSLRSRTPFRMLPASRTCIRNGGNGVDCTPDADKTADTNNMRFYLAFFALLLLVLRSECRAQHPCTGFLLEPVEGGQRWTTCACTETEKSAIRARDGVDFVIIDEQIQCQQADAGTTGAMAIHALKVQKAATATACWRFTLKDLESPNTWQVDACDADADAIRAKDGVEYILVEEVGI